MPFLKWAGGKRWLFNDEFISELPRFERYVEPFLGGGAGFFSLRPISAVLSDVNGELIELYEAIRDCPAEMEVAMREHQHNHNEQYYYKIRSERHDSKIERAARTLYLNRACWNGLYRVNRMGQFNVPKGTKNAIYLNSDDFKSYASQLKYARLLCSDFEQVVDSCGAGDLIFADPPYTVRHNLNGFIKYNEQLFRWSDQVRLRDALARARSRGAHVFVTNADHISIQELYRELAQVRRVGRQSVISGDVSGRSKTSELIISL